MDRHFFYCYWLKIDFEKIALPGERSFTDVLPCWVGFGWNLLSQASSRLYDKKDVLSRLRASSSSIFGDYETS